MRVQRLLEIQEKIKGLKSFKCREDVKDPLHKYFEALGIDLSNVDKEETIHSYFIVMDYSVVVPDHMPDWFKELNHNGIMSVTNEVDEDGEIEDIVYCENFYKYESQEYTEITL